MHLVMSVNSLPYICHFCCTHCMGSQDRACSLHHNDYLDNSALMCQCKGIYADLHLVFETTIHQYTALFLQTTNDTETVILHMRVHTTALKNCTSDMHALCHSNICTNVFIKHSVLTYNKCFY